MSLLKPRIAAALPLVIADWRKNGAGSAAYPADYTDSQVLADIFNDFNRDSIVNGEFDSDELDLCNAYDVVTDPANREFVDAVAIDLFVKPKFAAALPLVLADWRENGVAPSRRKQYAQATDLAVLGDILWDFNRDTLGSDDEWAGCSNNLRNAYDLVTDPANRELVDAVATELYA